MTRQCIIKSNSLEDIKTTCLRNIRNANLTEIDMIEEGDGTAADYEALSHFRNSWSDLLEDVENMLDSIL